MTRILCISDTHGDHDKAIIKSADIVIHAGDFSSYGHREDTICFLRWYNDLPCKHKILISGNHDKLPFERPKLFQELLKAVAPGVTYLEDSEANVLGLRIWGAPWTPTFLKWYFMADRGAAIKYHWDKIPEGIDVLVTHGPPNGFLDLSNNWNHALGRKWDDHLGCSDLKEAVYRVRPRLHVFGHIHGSGGRQMNYIDDDGHKTIMVNASIMDESYIANHDTVVIDL